MWQPAFGRGDDESGCHNDTDVENWRVVAEVAFGGMPWPQSQSGCRQYEEVDVEELGDCTVFP
jgi:hypothetical protein